MAFRAVGDDVYLSPGDGPDPTSDYTIVGHARTPPGTGNEFHCIFYWGNGPNTSISIFFTSDAHASATTWYTEILGTSSFQGSNDRVPDTHYSWAVLKNGDDYTVWAWDENFVEEFQDDTNTTDDIGQGGGGGFWLGATNTYADPTDDGAIIGPVKVWTAALTEAEILNEIRRYRPWRTSDIWAYWPCLGTTEAAVGLDRSGNANDLSATGSPTYDDFGPPIPWGGEVVVHPFAAAAATGDDVDSWGARHLAPRRWRSVVAVE